MSTLLKVDTARRCFHVNSFTSSTARKMTNYCWWSGPLHEYKLRNDSYLPTHGHCPMPPPPKYTTVYTSICQKHCSEQEIHRQHATCSGHAEHVLGTRSDCIRFEYTLVKRNKKLSLNQLDTVHGSRLLIMVSSSGCVMSNLLRLDLCPSCLSRPSRGSTRLPQ